MGAVDRRRDGRSGHMMGRAPGILQGERGLIHIVVIDGSGPQHGRPARGARRQAGPVDKLLVSLRLAEEQKAQAATTDRQNEVGGGRARDLQLEAALLEQLRCARALGRGRNQKQARHLRSPWYNSCLEPANPLPCTMLVVVLAGQGQGW